MGVQDATAAAAGMHGPGRGGASLVPPRLDAHANADAGVLYEPPFVSARPAAGLHAREGRVQAAY